MAQPFPYTYYSCSCVDTSTTSKLSNARKASSQQAEPDEESEETFDPRSPRANFSLFPLEHLLYCTECHQVRCPRCITEEVVCWYCPGCLFEVPSSTVRSEGNRCTRSCYNCPVCTSYLSVSALEDPADDSAQEGPGGPYILSCFYCQWTSLDIGIKFEKSNNITSQLSKIRNGGLVVPSAKERESAADKKLRRGSDHESAQSPVEDQATDLPPDTDEAFARLNTFYKQQAEEAAESSLYSSAGSELNYASPSSINRLLNMYAMGKRPKARKPKPMRSAHTPSEGLQLFSPLTETHDIETLHTQAWENTTSPAQLSFQERSTPRFLSDLRPVATLLRTKRSKRCRTCRTLLSRPEPKVSTTRYKIKVLASTSIPSVSLRSLTSPPTTSRIHPLTALPPAQKGLPYAKLTSLLPHQFLLTVSNPLFDAIHVTLATPALTPGRVQNRITILCPSFEVGANTDMWDEALNSSASAVAKRRSAMPGGSGGAAGDEGRVAEVGKIWERGRNWTSVVLEVVPGVLPGAVGSSLTTSITGKKGGQEGSESERDEEDEGLQDDEDVIEIPVFVRVEYETEAGGGTGGVSEERKEGAPKERREVVFWCVLGVGRIVG